jgi:surface protein
MKTSKFDSNERPTTATSTTTNENINSPADEEVGGSPQPSPSSDMLAEAKNPVSKPDFLGGEPVKPVEDEGFWHQRKVRRRALVILFLATIGLIVAVSVDVAVSNGNGDAGSSGSTASEPSALACFDTTIEIREAVDSYLADKRSDSSVASTYGWPIGEWCVSNIEDFSELFSVDRNPAAVNFNEDISRWDLSRATTMRLMFSGSYDASTSFDQPIGDWDVSSVTDMSYMFYNTVAFNQPLADWNVSNVTDLRRMFQDAISFNQPLADWNVSIVTDMSNTFYNASSFDQSLANWNVSTDIDKTFIFGQSGCPGEVGQECCFDSCSE